ncbi:hypothetical protein [Paenibacillus polymyxa]|uniref:hypothetical protein n=1 Tax=Paenibacillus polymyxa TaxID=1406 RepID=UPI001868B01F|nr:hypothetical protein [Paenibacillus polymyxa]MBE3650941.1 hypothetical protein [Paenibacillus polymyxa]
MDKRERLKEYIDKDRYAPEAKTGKRHAKKVFRNLDTGDEAYSGYYAFLEWRGADRGESTCKESI